MDYLATILKRYRKNAGLTQQQVADIIGIKRSAYAYYEVGKSLPKLATLTKLASMYNTSVDNLIDGDKPVSGKLNSGDPAAESFSADTGWRTSDGMNQLSDFEQTVLLRIRLMSFNEKEELMKFLYPEVK